MKKKTSKRKKNKKTSFLPGIAALTVVCVLFGALLISAKVRDQESPATSEVSSTSESVVEEPEIQIPEDLDVPDKITSASTDHFAWIIEGKVFLNGAEIPGQDEAAYWTDLKQVAVADDHIIGLDSQSMAHAVGNNTNLQCGLNEQRGYISIAAGLNCSAAVFFDGTIHTYGTMADEVREALQAETNAKEVDFGEGTVVVLRNDGTVAAAGNNEHGECNVEKWKDIVMIAAGTYCTVGLKKDGTVVIAGDNAYGQKDAEKWSGISYIAAGGRHIVGIKKDGSVVAAGRNDHGECRVDGWKDVVSVAAGYDHTLGLTAAGEVLTAGYDVNDPFGSDSGVESN